MARNRSRKRDASVPSLTLNRLLSVSRPLSPSPSLSPLTPFADRVLFASDMLSDRREFHPLQSYRPATYSTGGQAPIRLKDRSYGRKPPTLGASQTKAIQVFGTPKSVAICVRRHRRREVLFAKKRAGRSGPQRRHRRTWWSNVSC